MIVKTLHLEEFDDGVLPQRVHILLDLHDDGSVSWRDAELDPWGVVKNRKADG